MVEKECWLLPRHASAFTARPPPTSQPPPPGRETRIDGISADPEFSMPPPHRVVLNHHHQFATFPASADVYAGTPQSHAPWAVAEPEL